MTTTGAIVQSVIVLVSVFVGFSFGDSKEDDDR